MADTFLLGRRRLVKMARQVLGNWEKPLYLSNISIWLFPLILFLLASTWIVKISFPQKSGYKFPIKWKPGAVRPPVFLSHNLLDLRKLILSNIFEKKAFHFVAV